MRVPRKGLRGLNVNSDGEEKIIIISKIINLFGDNENPLKAKEEAIVHMYSYFLQLEIREGQFEQPISLSYSK